ncbi:MAG: hypothetical protein EAZ55_13360 [Cytophagales bacterium]|nr:MAG: hypothetical protein EAZ55_13360 [Cytophagales bacterium]
MSKKEPVAVLFLCSGSKCREGNKKNHLTAKHYLRKKKEEHTHQIIHTHCTKKCALAPVACLMPQNEWIWEASKKTIKKALKKNIKKKS